MLRSFNVRTFGARLYFAIWGNPLVQKPLTGVSSTSSVAGVSLLNILSVVGVISYNSIASMFFWNLNQRSGTVSLVFSSSKPVALPLDNSSGRMLQLNTTRNLGRNIISINNSPSNVIQTNNSNNKKIMFK
jgi:hypothetical protein